MQKLSVAETLYYQQNNSRSLGDSCWFHHLTKLTGEVVQQLLELSRAVVGCCAIGWRLRGGAMTRLTARRTRGRARVFPLNALGLQKLLAMAGIISMVSPNI